MGFSHWRRGVFGVASPALGAAPGHAPIGRISLEPARRSTAVPPRGTPRCNTAGRGAEAGRAPSCSLSAGSAVVEAQVPSCYCAALVSAASSGHHDLGRWEVQLPEGQVSEWSFSLPPRRLTYPYHHPGRPPIARCRPTGGLPPAPRPSLSRPLLATITGRSERR